MIVVIGSPVGRAADGAVSAGGTASRVALAAAATGAAVQLVGKIGDDATADAVILDLARGGVGHVALLRDPVRATPLEQLDEATADLDRPDDEPDRVPVDPGREASPDEDGSGLEAADVDLGLRYLTEFSVVVLVGPAGSEIVTTAVEATSWADARLVVVVAAGRTMPTGLPDDVVVFEAPHDDPDGAFATLVGSFAAGLDTGAAPGDAFRSSVALDGWSPTPEDVG